jgi:hypothetical protein
LIVDVALNAEDADAAAGLVREALRATLRDARPGPAGWMEGSWSATRIEED